MMKNSKLRRILVLLACAVLLVSLSVGATLAYLTSTADVENTFTVGNVEIKLDEATVDPETGKALNSTDRTEDGNKLVRMVPGRMIDKDPTVTVLANSEDCYVRVKVTVDVSKGWPEIKTEEDEAAFVTWAGSFASNYIRNDRMQDGMGFNTVDWTVSDPSVSDGTIDTNKRTVTYILTYRTSDGENIVANATSDTELPAIFTHVQVPASLDQDGLAKLANMSIKVVAEAIQAEGFENEAAAWTNFPNQN